MSAMAGAVGRRGFARRVLGALAALFGLPGVASLLDPVFRRGGGAWQEAGRLSDLTEGAAKPVDVEVRAGWERRKERALLVRKGGGVLAFRARCTHLGCTVRFRDGKLRCPCHGGVFGLDGAPEEGPVTEPLERLEAEVDGDRVRVRA